MIVLLAALLFAAPPPIGLAPTGSKPPGVLWYGYSVRTGAADIRVDNVAQVAPPNSRTTRYTSSIAHGGALSRVDVALGTPHGSVVYYDSNPPAHITDRLFSPNYQSGVPPLVPFPQGYVHSFGADGPPVPTQRFIGQVDHSQQPLAVSSLGPRIGTHGLASVAVVSPDVGGGPSQEPPFSATVRSRPVLSQPLGPGFRSGTPLYSPHPNQPGVTTKKAAVITLVVQPAPSPELGTSELPSQGIPAADAISERPKPYQVPGPFRTANHEISGTDPVLSRPTDDRQLESSGTVTESDVEDSITAYEDQENVKQPIGSDEQSSATAASVALQTSQSQDTSSVVKNQIKTPVVLNNGRGQYDFRGYRQFEGHPGAEEIPEAPEDSRTSKKHRHNFRVS